MTSSRELLARARARQIAIQEGRDPGEAIKRPQSRQQHNATPKLPTQKNLGFSNHARRRMAQSGLTAKHVYAVYRFGEEYHGADGRSLFHASAQAIENAPGYAVECLRQCAGMAIVVAREEAVLVTVMAFGGDTRVWRRKA